jgi:hypothetical protein
LGVDEREMGQKKGMERRPATFQAARWRGAEGGKGEGVPCGRSHVEMEEEGRGGPGMVVGSAGRPATTPDRRAWAAALPREQGRGRGWATQCERRTRRLERDGGPGVSDRAREREARWRWGADRRARATQCRGGGSNGILNRFKTFKWFTWIQKFPKL